MDEMEEKKRKVDSSLTSIPAKDGESFSCLFDILLEWVEVQPNNDLWAFVDHDGLEVESISYLGAAKSIGMLANALTSSSRGFPNLKPGDRTLLVYPPGLAFIIAFMACLRAGIVAVPVYPPDPRKAKNDIAAFSKTAASCGAKVALTSSAYGHLKKINDIKSFGGGKLKWPELRWIKTDSILQKILPRRSQIGLDQLRSAGKRVACDEPAFLQYTSGSTSDPKGAIVSHRNLYHNLSLIVDQLNAKSDTIVCSWLPQYHDMGLIGSYLGVLFCGGRGYYMSPLSFIRHPALWILVTNYYRATHLQSPSFGYALCARKWHFDTKQPKRPKWQTLPETQLDLSCVRHMVNGAEPIDYRAIDAFYETFCPYGLKRGVVFPSYGLAEHTLYVCGNGRLRVHIKEEDLHTYKRAIVVKEEMEKEVKEEINGFTGEEPERDQVLANTEKEDKKNEKDDGVVVYVGCGKPCKKYGVDVQIVDSSSLQSLGEDRVGEVWIKSDSKSLGYWGMTLEKSLQTFCAHFLIDGKQSRCAMAEDVLGSEATISSSMGALTVKSDVHVKREGYLRSGDEGFIHGGELFICGRIKDLIIILGRNFYPLDLERSVETTLSDSLRPGCSAAFGVAFTTGYEHEEKLVLVCEVREHIKKSGSENPFLALADSACSIIKQQHGIQASIIIFVPAHGNKKTTSGKIARNWSKKAFVDGELDILHLWKAKNDELLGELKQQDNPFEDKVCADPHRVEEVDISNLGFEEVQALLVEDVSQIMGSNSNLYTTVPLYQLGLDSMAMGQFSGVLSQYGCNLSGEDLFSETMTIAHIANLITSSNTCSRISLAETSAQQQTFHKAGKCESCIVSYCPCCFCFLSWPCC